MNTAQAPAGYPGATRTGSQAPSYIVGDTPGQSQRTAGIDARSVLLMLLSQPSPTGHERALAELISQWASQQGLVCRIDRGGGESANVVITVPGTDPRAKSLLIYAPIDTLGGPDPHELAPWLGSASARQQWLRAQEIGGWIIGEGAENPKGYAAAALVAAAALSRSGSPPGDVHVALCGGSVPSLGNDAASMGLGSGVLRLLQRGLCADGALACKPGWYVSHEEAGVVWLRVQLSMHGAYVGTRHTLPYRNVIPVAASLAAKLEAWFEHYADQQQIGTIAPQGAVTAIRAGVPELAAFVGETCELCLDVRLAPNQTPAATTRLVRDVIEDALAGQDVAWTMQTVASVPPSASAADAMIVAAARTAWEELEHRQAPAPVATSGASDANLLRAWGIPTARVGMPLPAQPDAIPTDPFGLNAVEVNACEWFSRLLTRTATIFGHISQQAE